MAAVQDDDGAPSRWRRPSGMAATTTAAAATIGRRIMSIMTSTCRPSSHRCLDGVCVVARCQGGAATAASGGKAGYAIILASGP